MLPLIDPYGRRIEYLRLSVTDRCDLRCSYCIPEGFHDFEAPADWLDFAEIERLVGILARLGVRRLRLTGGEPLTRRGIVELAGRLSVLPGIEDLSLSTNATQLARYAAGLKAAGVGRLNVSLDSLRPERIAKITGRPVLGRVLEGLEAAKAAGFSPIKINMVALAGENDDEIDEMVAFCLHHGFILRFIETMPMGATGRAAGFLDLQPVKARLRERFRLLDAHLPGGGPARYLSTADRSFSLGFITPLSQHFCETCNRVRLTVDGMLHLCLGQEDRLDLRSLLRGGADDAAIETAVRGAVAMKPQRHEFREAPGKIVRFMTSTGG